MKSEVLNAIEELKTVYGEDSVDVSPDDKGGAYVIINNIDVGNNFKPAIIWCGFYINHMYPISDIYPHFINSELVLASSGRLGNPFQYNINWNNRKAVQVSRRSKRWNPNQDSAILKLEKVINFIKQQ